MSGAFAWPAFTLWEAVERFFPQKREEFWSWLDDFIAMEYIRLRDVTSFYPRMVHESHALREAVADFAVIEQVL